jgi:glycosyltransferase involved in cell wall biosynthesis
VHHQVTHLRKLGHTVHVAGPEHCPLTTIPLFVTPFHVFNPGVKISTLHPSSVASVLAIVRDLDVVHLFCPANPTFYALLPVFCECNIPVVCSHHCDPSQFRSLLGPVKPIALKLMQTFYELFEPFVAIHLVPTMTRENITFLDFARRIDVMPTGIDVSLFSPLRIQDPSILARCKTIVYVGRLSPEKSCETMLRFFKRFVSTAPSYAEYRLRIVGDGPSRATLDRIARVRCTALRTSSRWRVPRPSSIRHATLSTTILRQTFRKHASTLPISTAFDEQST